MLWLLPALFEESVASPLLPVRYLQGDASKLEMLKIFLRPTCFDAFKGHMIPAA